MSCKGGIAPARWSDEVTIAFAVQCSRVAACPSFNASARQPRKVREPALLKPTSFVWNGDWSTSSVTGSQPHFKMIAFFTLATLIQVISSRSRSWEPD